MKRFAVLLILVAAALPARASTHVLPLRCNGNGGIAAMENSYIAATGFGDCWFHIGHHTYDTGAPHVLGAMTGAAFTVETAFSPPTEFGEGRNHSVLTIEGSMDGVAWATLARISYNIFAQRQSVAIEADAGGATARFIRIRQPRSAAQGLSGYLDSSWLDVEATLAPTPVTARAESMSCADHIMERFFSEHPCWFGGVNRYDSPSVFHTYPITPGQVSRVSGSASVLPWRSDDFYYDGADPTSAELLVQVSNDAVTWSEAGRVQVPYGVETAFDVAVEQEASFVRLVGEYHHGVTRHPALKHVRAMMLSSRIDLHR